MILVDASVWIDYLRGAESWQTDRLESLLDTEALGIGDLSWVEVLQGCIRPKDFAEARHLLSRFDFIVLGGRDVATLAAENYRRLRRLGVTVRSTIDVVLATRCIVSDYRLLHDDQDFDAFAQHLGLRCVLPDS